MKINKDKILVEESNWGLGDDIERQMSKYKIYRATYKHGIYSYGGIGKTKAEAIRNLKKALNGEYDKDCFLIGKRDGVI
jgi:hypothetical protein